LASRLLIKAERKSSSFGLVFFIFCEVGPVGFGAGVFTVFFGMLCTFFLRGAFFFSFFSGPLETFLTGGFLLSGFPFLILLPALGTPPGEGDRKGGQSIVFTPLKGKNQAQGQRYFGKRSYFGFFVNKIRFALSCFLEWMVAQTLSIPLYSLFHQPRGGLLVYHF
jgi:hypothetical protein